MKAGREGNLPSLLFLVTAVNGKVRGGYLGIYCSEDCFINLCLRVLL